MQGLCGSGAASCDGLSFKNMDVFSKIPNCGEQSTCINIDLPGRWYLSGVYCPVGNNGIHGPVFRKDGITLQDSFYLAAYDSTRDSDAPNTVLKLAQDTAQTAKLNSDCSVGTYVLKVADPTTAYQDPSTGYIELKGSTITCLKTTTADFLATVFSKGKDTITITDRKTGTAQITGLNCGQLNTTTAGQEGEAEDQEGLVSPIVIDDPVTSDPADHWLHPCECAPTAWGKASPITPESFEDVPPGSGNAFRPANFEIVVGQFVCEMTSLIALKSG